MTAAGDCIRRAKRAGLSWPLPEDLSDAALERLVYPPPQATAKDRRPQPDWAAVHRELRRSGVTLQLLWEEHRGAHSDGYGYSRYCELYRAWEGRLSPTMRQVHVAGERMFVDYAGTTLEVVDGTTGEVRVCQLFVAVLGASNYTYAEATFTQRLVDWIGSHVRAFGFFGGVTAQIVSDNLRSGITKACFYEPAVNRTYAEMAAHYGTAVVPARPRKPRDKAKVEVAVSISCSAGDREGASARIGRRTFTGIAIREATPFVLRAAGLARQATPQGSAKKLGQARDHFVCELYSRRCGHDDAQDAHASIVLFSPRPAARLLTPCSVPPWE